MLTLTRKAGQKIRIGDNIEIVVREIRGRQVRLGISAPEGLEVFREELYQQILAEAEAEATGADAGNQDAGNQDAGNQDAANASNDRRPARPSGAKSK